MERTFAIIKPDAVAAGQSGEIIAIAQKAGFRIAGMKMKRLSQLEAEGFYAVHRERPFYASLVKFMTEGPVVVMVLEAPDAIKKWRDTMGATNPAISRNGAIRWARRIPPTRPKEPSGKSSRNRSNGTA